MTAHVEVKTNVKAPANAVWDILDDFENIADYTDQVKTSVSTSENATGVGAGRFCELAPFGTTNEEILEYTPGGSMVIRLYDITGLPVKSTRSTFSVRPVGENESELTFSSEVHPKGGIFAGFLSKRLEKRLPKGAQSMVDDLARSAEQRVASA